MVNETEIVSRYRSGVSVPLLIREYGGDLVYTVLTRELGDIPNPGANFLPYQKPGKYRRMKYLVSKGWTKSRIAKDVGSEWKTVHRWFPDHNGTTLRMGLDKYNRIKEMLEEGCSHSEITRTLGVDYRDIKRWFPGTQWDQYGGGKAEEVRMMKRKLEEVGRDVPSRD